MKLNKRLSLERHAYAPELSRLRVHSGPARTAPTMARLSAAGARTLREARDAQGWRPIAPGLWAVVTATRTGAFPLSDVKAGRVASLLELRQFVRSVREYYAGGVLFDGRILPAATVSVRVQLLG